MQIHLKVKLMKQPDISGYAKSFCCLTVIWTHSMTSVVA